MSDDMKKIISVILLFFTVFVCSCTRSDLSKEDFDFIEKSGIEISDIGIAYIHSEIKSLESDILQIKEHFHLISDKIGEYNVEKYPESEKLYSAALAAGYNVFIFDENVSESIIAYGASKYKDRYFISKGIELSFAFDNLMCFSGDFIDDSYILGYICATKSPKSKLGILTDDTNNYVYANSFAEGARLANANVSIIASQNASTLDLARCSYVYVPSPDTVDYSPVKTKAVGFDLSESSSLSVKVSYKDFLIRYIESIINGAFISGTVKADETYRICEDGFSAITDEDQKAKIARIRELFSAGVEVFSNVSMRMQGDEIITVKEALTDNKQNIVIDESGNYYYYSQDGNDLIICSSMSELLSGKMNYYMQSIEQK